MSLSSTNFIDGGETLRRNGFFSEPPFINVGTPYVTKDPLESDRHKGRQIKAFHPKTGSGPDVLLDGTFRTLYDGDTFVDKWKLEKKMERENGPPTLGRGPFKPTSPTKRPTGAGSLYGTIGRVPLQTKSLTGSAEPAKRDDARKTSKNFYTNPARKGGFGFPVQDRTIGGNAPQYMRDDFEPGLHLTRKARAESRKKIPKPFSSGGKCKPYFDASLHKYMEEGFQAPVRKTAENTGKKPFRPSSPGPKDRFAVISKVGRNYIPEAEMPEKKTDLKSTRGGKFVPPGGGHSKYTYDINPYSRPAIPDKAPVYVWEASL